MYHSLSRRHGLARPQHKIRITDPEMNISALQDEKKSFILWIDITGRIHNKLIDRPPPTIAQRGETRGSHVEADKAYGMFSLCFSPGFSLTGSYSFALRLRSESFTGFPPSRTQARDGLKFDHMHLASADGEEVDRKREAG